MILIADAGSTKTGWCLLDTQDEPVRFETEAYHPFFVNSEYIIESLKNNLPPHVKAIAEEISEIYFYSAGGGYSTNTDNILINGLQEVFRHSAILIETDLLAAARSLLADTPGFAAILGTGTNTCIYDGEKVVHNIESLGFILGDEGSGSYIGKKLIGDYIRGYMPPQVKPQFQNHLKMSPDELINEIYTQPMANKFCAGFCPFVAENINHPYYEKLVYDSFSDLFRNIICNYRDYQKYSFNCVGSVALNFQDILSAVANHYKMKMGTVVQYPMDGLVSFHLKT